MLNADQLTMDDVQRLFPDHEFTEAAGVLDMISKIPEQQQLYDARLKFQLNEAARLELAREEGLREGEMKGAARGIKKGEMLGQIKLLQKLLSISNPPSDELSSYDVVQLSELVQHLQDQLRNRSH